MARVGVGWLKLTKGDACSTRNARYHVVYRHYQPEGDVAELPLAVVLIAARTPCIITGRDSPPLGNMPAEVDEPMGALPCRGLQCTAFPTAEGQAWGDSGCLLPSLHSGAGVV
eukprot:gene16164-biopygen5021